MTGPLLRRALLAAALTAAVTAPAMAPTAALERPRTAILDAVPGTPVAPPAVTAAAWALVDARSGQVLAGRAIDEPRPVASTVKLLTALTVVERASPDEQVVVPDAVAGVGGASTSVDPGETWTVRKLLEALLVRSGNDAATALALHVGGTVEEFMALMRADAATLGLSPILATPSGLDDRNRLTARDLAVISRAVLADELLAEIVALPTVTLPDLGELSTRNLLLVRYADANGLKTGFTNASGNSVIGSATRDGRTLIAVVLGSEDPEARFTDAAALLDHGFSDFEEVRVGRTSRVRGGGRWVTVGTGEAWVSVAAGTDVAVDWRLPRRVDQPGQVTVRIPRVDPFTLPATAQPAPPRSPSVGTWLRDRIHQALRTLAADGP